MSFANPEQIVTEFGLLPGEEVVEFGAGVGAYTLACAKAVGQAGKIYAVDVQKDLLENIRHQAQTFGLNNIEYLWGDVEELGGVKLRDQLADVVLLASVFFQLTDKTKALIEAKRLLRSGGRIILIDWLDTFGGLGPQSNMVVTAEKAETMLIEAGFKKIKHFEAGDHHYGLIFQRLT